MPIPIVCPSCSARLRAPDGTAGRKAKCPNCGTAVLVSNPASKIPERPSLDDSPRQPPRDVPPLTRQRDEVEALDQLEVVEESSEPRQNEKRQQSSRDRKSDEIEDAEYANPRDTRFTDKSAARLRPRKEDDVPPGSRRFRHDDRDVDDVDDERPGRRRRKKRSALPWILGASCVGVVVLVSAIVAVVLAMPPALPGTSWTGNERLAEFDQLRFEFKSKTEVLMFDAQGRKTGHYSQDGHAVRIRFLDCVYTGTIMGRTMSGSAEFTAGPASGTRWTWSAERD